MTEVGLSPIEEDLAMKSESAGFYYQQSTG